MTAALRGASGAPVIGVAGWKKSGKTTLTVRLVEELTRRGLVVATVKHAHHAFQIDDGDTDSARHRRAGAREVAIVSPDRWALVHELGGASEPDLADVVGWLGPCDVILVEGYKSAPIPKIEARRTAAHQRTPLAPGDPMVFAIAADHEVADAGVPVLPLDAVPAIADLLCDRFGLASRAVKEGRHGR